MEGYIVRGQRPGTRASGDRSLDSLDRKPGRQRDGGRAEGDDSQWACASPAATNWVRRRGSTDPSARAYCWTGFECKFRPQPASSQSGCCVSGDGQQMGVVAWKGPLVRPRAPPRGGLLAPREMRLGCCVHPYSGAAHPGVTYRRRPSHVVHLHAMALERRSAAGRTRPLEQQAGDVERL